MTFKSKFTILLLFSVSVACSSGETNSNELIGNEYSVYKFSSFEKGNGEALVNYSYRDLLKISFERDSLVFYSRHNLRNSRAIEYKEDMIIYNKSTYRLRVNDDKALIYLISETYDTLVLKRL